jgi:HD-GYP domain-containing protein (c-di-GMP phosphodiesterase class II)
VCEAKLGPVPEGADGAQGRVTITDFVDELIAALLTMRLYERKHTRVRGRIDELRRLHRQIFAVREEHDLVLGTTQGFLLHEDRPLLGASAGAATLVHGLASRSSGGLQFARELGDADFEQVLLLLAAPVPGETHDLANRRLQKNGCSGIRLLPPYHPGSTAPRGTVGLLAGTVGASPGDLRIPMRMRQTIVRSLQEASLRAASGQEIDLQDVQTIAQTLSDGVRGNAGEVQDLVRYERYDAFTFGHSVRVCALAVDFASRLSSDPRLQLRIGTAALLHDIGKVGIAPEVLHHRGRLSPEQRREMERHAALGSAILLEQKDVDDVAVAVSHGHHQNLDGTGYPADRLSIEHSVVTRLIRICDVYEALTAVRPYKGAMSPIQAFRVMLESPGAFDTGLLRRFIAVTGAYPSGSEVELSDGRIARVAGQTGEILRPVVSLEKAGSGEALDERDRGTIDLSSPEQKSLRIARVLEPATLDADLQAA